MAGMSVASIIVAFVAGAVGLIFGDGLFPGSSEVFAGIGLFGTPLALKLVTGTLGASSGGRLVLGGLCGAMAGVAAGWAVGFAIILVRQAPHHAPNPIPGLALAGALVGGVVGLRVVSSKKK